MPSFVGQRINLVIALATPDRIIPSLAKEKIVAITAINLIIIIAAIDKILAAAALNPLT